MKLSKVLLEGSYAVVAYFKFVCDLEATKIIPMTTKNVAEFTTLLSALKKAHSLKLTAFCVSPISLWWPIL